MVTIDVVNMDRCDCNTAASTHNHSVLQINGAGLAARHRMVSDDLVKWHNIISSADADNCILIHKISSSSASLYLNFPCNDWKKNKKKISYYTYIVSESCIRIKLYCMYHTTIKYQIILFICSYYLLYPIRGIKARSGCGWGVGQQFCTAGAHQKYSLRTLPGHMVRPPLRQRVWLIPLSIECKAGWPSSPIRTATRSVGWLWMISPTWVREAGQHTAPVTRKPHLGRGAGVISIILTSRYQEC